MLILDSNTTSNDIIFSNIYKCTRGRKFVFQSNED